MKHNTKERINKKEFVLLICIFLLAIILRVIYLGEIPAGMHQDEAFSAWTALSLLRNQIDSAGSYLPVYLAGWGDGQSALYSWCMMPFLLLNNSEWSPIVSRFPQALFGILTIVAVYFMIKEMFGKVYSLWAAFLLSVCPWHVMMCRWGLEANLAPAFLIFGLYFFVLGLKNNKYYVLSAILYGLSLYTYAVIWPIVPIILLLQLIYAIYHKKVKLCWGNFIAAGLLGFIASPLITFFVINTFKLSEIKLPFMTIPIMPRFRGEEVALSVSQMWYNIKQLVRLLVRQDTGSPYDILKPSGMFYDIGRIFIFIGVMCLLYNLIRKLLRKEFAYEFFIFAQLVGAGLNALLISVRVHQVNSLFVPLVLCEAYGVASVLNFCKRYKKIAANILATVFLAVYLINLAEFQYTYYTDYKELVNNYFAQGVQECVEFAIEQVEELKSITEEPAIVYERGAQWPRVLLYSDITAPEYLATVSYKADNVEPVKYVKDGITWYNGIDYENIKKDAIYIIYFPDVPKFEENYNLTKFYDWYVAVPK